MPTDLSNLIDTFADRHVVVIGEVMLDRYLMGQANRLCQEAPVPVVTLSDRCNLPGGAANVAVNLHQLGAQVSLLSVIGDDVDGRCLQQTLEQSGIATEALLIQPARRTLLKQRIMAASQMLLRLDDGSTDAIAPNVEQQLIDRLTDLFWRCDAVIISDYNYGILTPQVIQTIAHLQAKAPRFIVADSKRLASYSAMGVTVVKPNYEEALQLLGNQRAAPLKPGTGRRSDDIVQYGEQLLNLTGADVVIVTLDAEGAIVLQHHGSPHHIAAKATRCLQPTGAGDTFISALTLALTGGASAVVAAELATIAAATVVAKEGTATCSAQELQALPLSQLMDLDCTPLIGLTHSPP